MKYLCLVYCDEKLYSDFPEDRECLAYGEAAGQGVKPGWAVVSGGSHQSRFMPPACITSMALAFAGATLAGALSELGYEEASRENRKNSGRSNL